MSSEVLFRRATRADVPTIIALLLDDELGATRESADDPGYLAAFDRVAADDSELLVVAEVDGEVVATLQLSLLPGLSLRGSTRAQLEAVRVRSDQRGLRIGEKLIEYAANEAKRRGATTLQLTSNASRSDAHRFYERLGFTASHVGFKRSL